MRRSWVFGSVLLLVAGAGCAGTLQQTNESSGATRAIEEVGRKDAPRAAIPPQLAKEALAKATALREGMGERLAPPLLTRAEVDAALAVQPSRVSSEKQDAAKAVDRARRLRPHNAERNLP